MHACSFFRLHRCRSEINQVNRWLRCHMKDAKVRELHVGAPLWNVLWKQSSQVGLNPWVRPDLKHQTNFCISSFPVGFYRFTCYWAANPGVKDGVYSLVTKDSAISSCCRLGQATLRQEGPSGKCVFLSQTSTTITAKRIHTLCSQACCVRFQMWLAEFIKRERFEAGRPIGWALLLPPSNTYRNKKVQNPSKSQWFLLRCLLPWVA